MEAGFEALKAANYPRVYWADVEQQDHELARTGEVV